MYELDPEALHRVLTYSEIHGNKLSKGQVIEYVNSLNLYKSLSIVCELLSLRNKSITKDGQYLWWGFTINVPFESAMKNFI